METKSESPSPLIVATGPVQTGPEEPGYRPGAVDRFIEVVDKLLIHFNIGPLERTAARGILKVIARDASDEQIAGALSTLRAEIIPYVLHGPSHEVDQD